MAQETFYIQELEVNLTEDENKKENLYVVFELDGDKVQTPAVKAPAGQSLASWSGESFTLHSKTAGDNLEVAVYNKHTLRPDQLIGSGRHHIRHQTQPGKLRISLVDKKDSPRGEVAFYLKGSGGRFNQTQGATTGTTSSTTTTGHHGAGAGLAGAAAGAVGAGHHHHTAGQGAGGAVARDGTTGITAAGKAAGSNVQGMSGMSERERAERGAAEGAAAGAAAATNKETRGTAHTRADGHNDADVDTIGSGMRNVGLQETTGRGTDTTGSGMRNVGLQETTGRGAQPICDQKYYTKVEDRPVVREVKTYTREHHPIEKEFVVETRPTGTEHELREGRASEVVDSKTRVVDVAQRDPCAGVPTTGTGIGAGAASAAGYQSGTRAGMGTVDKAESYIPGTDEHRAVQGGQTGTHSHGQGQGQGGMLERVKEMVPGTAEHKQAQAMK
jgi:hypothetical protein